MESSAECSLDFYPADILYRIFHWLTDTELIGLINLSNHVNKVLVNYSQLMMQTLKFKVKKEFQRVLSHLKDLPVREEANRLDYIKRGCNLRFLAVEIDLFFATVWHYRNDSTCWISILHLLLPVISEFEDGINTNLRTVDSWREYDLSSYRAKIILAKWFRLLDVFESEIEPLIEKLSQVQIPFELKCLETLNCCPTINSQLTLERVISTDRSYFNVYGFFQTNGLKPVFRVPRTEMDTDAKKRLIIRNLRENVQWENVDFHAKLSQTIHDLEHALEVSTEPHIQERIVSKLSRRYSEAFQNPYVPYIETTYVSGDGDETIVTEHYVRCPTYHSNLERLVCLIDLPQLREELVPLITPFLRGEFRGTERSQKIWSDDIGLSVGPINLQPNIQTTPKNRLQLIMQYRESYSAAPVLVSMDVSYDEMDECHVSFNRRSHYESPAPSSEDSDQNPDLQP